jgi:hypothetical protein
MYQRYEETVRIGLDTLHNFRYAVFESEEFQRTARELRAYLEKHRLPYSPDSSQEWVEGSREHSTHRKFNSRKKLTVILSDIFEHGYVTTTMRPKAERIP